MRRAAGGLLDEEDAGLIASLVGAFNEKREPGIIRMHRLRAIRAGRYAHVDAHLIVPEYWTVDAAHDALDAQVTAFRDWSRSAVTPLGGRARLT